MSQLEGTMWAVNPKFHASLHYTVYWKKRMQKTYTHDSGSIRLFVMSTKLVLVLILENWGAKIYTGSPRCPIPIDTLDTTTATGIEGPRVAPLPEPNLANLWLKICPVVLIIYIQYIGYVHTTYLNHFKSKCLDSQPTICRDWQFVWKGLKMSKKIFWGEKLQDFLLGRSSVKPLSMHLTFVLPEDCLV